MTRWNRETYFGLVHRAEYFRWQAVKGFPSAGRDPLTGLAKISDYWREAGRRAHIAQARVFFALARDFRLTH